MPTEQQASDALITSLISQVSHLVDAVSRLTPEVAVVAVRLDDVLKANEARDKRTDIIEATQRKQQNDLNALALKNERGQGIGQSLLYAVAVILALMTIWSQYYGGNGAPKPDPASTVQVRRG